MLTVVLALALALQPVRTFPLTVVGGTGSGDYPCGTAVQIVATPPAGPQRFAQWHLGWDGEVALVAGRVSQPTLTIRTPCHAARVEAKFAAQPPRRHWWSRR